MNKMEILAMRDFIRDDLGNYYAITTVGKSTITLVNAVVYYSFNRVLNNEFVEEVNKQYDHKPVAAGQVFTDLVINQIDDLTSGKYPGHIYDLTDVAKNYEIEVVNLYERDVVTK